MGLSARDGHDIQDVIHPVGFFDVVETVEVAHIFTSPGGYLRLPIEWGQPERSEPSTSTQAVAGQGE